MKKLAQGLTAFLAVIAFSVWTVSASPYRSRWKTSMLRIMPMRSTVRMRMRSVI